MKEIISYGGGTQSTAMILMALNGEFNLPKPDFAVWADTGAEPQFINDYVQYFTNYCKQKYNFDIYTVRHPKYTLIEGLRLWDGKDGTKKFKTLLPFYTLIPDGSRGIMKRKCTEDYKILPQRRFIKTKLTKGEKWRKWFGISFDERSRMKVSNEKGCENFYPLVENFVNRQMSIDYVKEQGLLPPQRSACVFCPFHSNTYWQWLKDFHPGEFSRACEVDEKVRELSIQDRSLKSKLFIHNSMKPLSEVNFTDKNQLDMWPELIDECDGLCGI